MCWSCVLRTSGGPCGFRPVCGWISEGSEPVWIASDDGWLTQTSDGRPLGGRLTTMCAGWQAASVLGPYGCAPLGTGGPSQPMLRSQLARKQFTLPAQPVRADLHSPGWAPHSALREWSAHLAGRPHFTRFDKRVQYQVYDVTAALHAGQTPWAWCWGMAAARTHWRGSLGSAVARASASLRSCRWRSPTAWQAINSDLSWHAADSPILFGLHLRWRDVRRAAAAARWSTRPMTRRWRPVSEAAQPVETLVCRRAETIQPMQWLGPVAITEPKPGVYVYDFGQNLTGWCRLTYSGKAGQTVTLRHAEVLNPDGTIYTDNLRSAQATDRYTMRGGPTEVWEPRFTYHGFRYVEVTGLGDKAYAGYLAARMICSAAPQIGQFECSNALVNSIQHNILWGQRGNMYSVPTDCPQRDERLGWTGDTQMFCSTACYNLDMARFFTKWMADIRDCQARRGRADVNPTNGGGPAAPAGRRLRHRPLLGLASLRRHPHHRDNFDCMSRWVGYMTANSIGLLLRARRLRRLDRGGLPAKPISAAYYFYDCVLLSQMADATDSDDARKYAELAERSGCLTSLQQEKRPTAAPDVVSAASAFRSRAQVQVDAVVDNLVEDIWIGRSI